jgi:hypothetical protein
MEFLEHVTTGLKHILQVGTKRLIYRHKIKKRILFQLKTIESGVPQWSHYRGADKSLARPGRKQATATEDFEFHLSYL